LTVAAVLLGLAVWAAAQADASSASRHRTIAVYSGSNALQRAVAGARAGDTLLIHGGRYTGQVLVDRALTLRGAPGRRPVIDGRCRTADTIQVQAPGVTVEHLQVVGASEGFGSYPSEVNFTGVPDGRAQDLVVRNTCDAEYGINVVRGGRQQIVANHVSGFSDSGIYVGQIHDTHGGALRVTANATLHNSRGIIVEFSTGVDIRVVGNDMSDNTLRGLGETPPSGLLINGSHGILIQDNRIERNGRYGIDFIADSTGNRLFGNVVRANPLAIHLESGSGPNCGSGNQPNTVPRC
jgi:parallel beta-helix repeat protein